MQVPAPALREWAIIFNAWNTKDLGPPDALIRHAYGQMYRDFTLVDTQQRPFNWKITFARTLRRFRSAVHRYAVNIRHFHARRRFTSQQDAVPEEAITRTFQLTRAFKGGRFSGELFEGRN